jgi:16S rRNA (cytosine1402-N4)-methyltransferase
MSSKHKSVLVSEVLEYLNPQPNKVYLDVTLGCGGHTSAILDKEPTCKVIGLDWDLDSIKENEPILKEKYGDRIMVLWGNFSNVYKLLKGEHIRKIDGVLADFGTSQLQIHERAGLSFMRDTPLDMRMSKSHFISTAADILNNSSERELIKILQDYGEESYARKIVRAIIAFREVKPLRTTLQLVKVIETAIPYGRDRGKKIHPATKTFQALRIAVNNELENIKALLHSVLPLVSVDGRIVCISFHSLEDRIVKTFFREHSANLKILTPKPVRPSDDEIYSNPSSRSAKLRAAEKL